MTYVSVITLVTYALVLGLLAVVSVIDIRSRRVPNGLAAALGFLWVAWRVVLGFAGAHMGLGFRAEFLGPAPDVLVPPGLEIGGISFASGLLGAVVLGGGLLVLTTLYELIRRKEAFGGGDIKLMAVLGLFLGLERGVVCLLTACLLSVAYVLGREFGRRVMKNRRDRSTGAFASADLAGTGAPSLSEPFLRGAIREVSSEHDRASLLAGTMPLALCIALGTCVAFVTGVRGAFPWLCTSYFGGVGGQGKAQRRRPFLARRF